MDRIFSNYDHTICNLCGSKKFKIILDLTGKVLRTNNMIVDSQLKKIECVNCGLVRDGISIKEKKLENHYSIHYKGHLISNEKAVFFTNKGSEERSKFVANWISKILIKSSKQKIDSIIEVGCGSGELISQLMKIYPQKNIIGLEVNKEAIQIGKNRGLDIRNIADTHHLPKTDLIISYAVLEHTPNPTKFLEFLVSLIKPDGMILLGQPHQDKLSDDIFFEDHLFHFSTDHIKELGRKVNLIQITKSMGKRPLSNFSFHLFRISKRKLNKKKIFFKSTKVKNSIKYYQKGFNHLNKCLANFKPKHRLAVFGLGEFFNLFQTYTNLSSAKISLGIDDFPPEKKFTFKIIPSSELTKEKVDCIILCVNPVYINIIKKKLGKNHCYLHPLEPD